MEQALAEVLKQGFLGVLLIIVTGYFIRELKTIRAERDACQSEMRDLHASMREQVIPAVVRMIDVTQTANQVILDVRADLKAERTRGP